MREHESIGAKRPPERCSGGRPLVSCWECSGVPVSLVCLRIPFRTGLHLAAARREVRRPQQILFWRAERLRGREYNPESLSEAENLPPQLVIRAPVIASFTAIARVRHHRREIARCCSNSAGARTSSR